MAIANLLLAANEFRAKWSDRLAAVRERCTARGIPLIHDVDDLIFDPAAMRFGQIAFIDQLPQQKRQRWLADALGFRHRSP